jgi:hypothetical protein
MAQKFDYLKSETELRKTRRKVESFRKRLGKSHEKIVV